MCIVCVKVSLSCMFVWMDVCLKAVPDGFHCQRLTIVFPSFMSAPPSFKRTSSRQKHNCESHTITHSAGLLFYAWVFPASNRTDICKYTHTFNKPMMSTDRSLMCMRCSVSVTRLVSLHKINQTRARSATCSIIPRGARLAQKWVIY